MGYVVADGKSNWLDGVILICKISRLRLLGVNLLSHHLGLYIIIAVTFWFYPGLSLWEPSDLQADSSSIGSDLLKVLAACTVRS